MDASNLNKWRLILGKYSDNQIGFKEEASSLNYMDMDELFRLFIFKENMVKKME